MGLQSALSTALTGLNAAETTIDVVGNNIANSNTIGFKSSKAVFATQFLQTQSLGSSPSATRGGTNPRQIGLGTKVAEISPDFTQGTIEISANPLDMAIQGDGFFIVQGSQGETLYSRNGQFKLNSQNELTTITGQRVLGFGIDDNFQVQATSLQPLSIPLGTAAVAQATQNVFLEGTLIPTGEIADTPNIIQSAILSNGEYEIPANLGSADVTVLNQTPSGTASATVGAAGALSAGTYEYRVTYVDADGNESPPTTAFSVANPGGNRIVLDDFPTLSSPYTSYNIYRTTANGTDFKQVATGVVGGALPYTDNATDASLAAAADLPDTLEQGNYTYYYTLLNTATELESRPSQLIGPIAIGASGRRVRLDDIVQPTTGDFNAVRIYRSLADGNGPFFQVADLTAGETSYIDGAADADIENNAELNLDGPAINSTTLLRDLVRRDGTTYEKVFAENGTLSFSASKGDRTLAAKSFEVTDTSTVQDLVQFMQQAMGIQETDQNGDPFSYNPGGSFTADSRLQFISNVGSGNALEVGLSSLQFVTASGNAESITLPFAETQAAEGETAVTDFVVYDSLGIPLNVRLTMVLESTTSASTTYRWYADSKDNDPLNGAEISVGTGTVSFDGEGNVLSVNSSTVSIDRRHVSSASPLEFELDFSQMSGLAAARSTLAASRQDGSSAGTLTSFIVTENGAVRGVFSNGITRDLGQIRLARFANNGGLEQVGENMFAAGVNSGLPVEGQPGENGIGSVSAGAVELSNTDIGKNLIDLILASTQYRGGTRVITAVQQLFDELLALRR